MPAHPQEEEGADLCELVPGAAEETEVLTVTSALTRADISNLRGKPKAPVSRREDVRLLFSREYVHVRMRRTAETARDRFWDQGIPSRDAVHVASALPRQRFL